MNDPEFGFDTPGNNGGALVRQEETSIAAPDNLLRLQIATAREFGRNVEKFKKDLRNLAATHQNVAESCIYCLPRGGGHITGPSVRFMETVAACWGNLREEKLSHPPGEREVIGEATVWDMESNRVARVQVSRRIVNREGKRFNDDMIQQTANAAASIAHRNALKVVIPEALWKPVFAEVEKCAGGGDKNLKETQEKWLAFWESRGVSRKRVLAAFKRRTASELGVGDLATLSGYYNALKAGDLDLDEAFPETDSPLDGPPTGKQSFRKKPTEKPETVSRETPKRGEKVGGKEQPVNLGRPRKEPPDVQAAVDSVEVKLPEGVTIAHLETAELPLNVYELGVKEKTRVVRAAKTRNAIDLAMIGEERKTVIDAANKRLSELKSWEEGERRAKEESSIVITRHTGDDAFPADPPTQANSGPEKSFSLEQEKAPPDPPPKTDDGRPGLLPAINAVRKATTLQELLVLERGEDRPEVINAIRKRVDEINNEPPPPTDADQPWNRHRDGYNPRR